MKCPCRGCENRTITCHGVCQEYKSWQEWHEGINKKKRMETDNRQLSHGLIRKYWRNIKLGRGVASR